MCEEHFGFYFPISMHKSDRRLASQMHKERVWSIRNGLVHHSLAAGPAARYIEL